MEMVPVRAFVLRASIGCVSWEPLDSDAQFSFATLPVPVLLCVLGSAATGWNGVMIAESVRMAPAGAAGAASGAVLAVTFMGAVLGPSGFALLVGAMGSYALAFAAVALLSAGGTAVAWHAHRQERRALTG